VSATSVDGKKHFEVVRPPSGSAFVYALFDFDGTLSLIREGWPEVMIPMMVEKLVETNTPESPDDLREIVREDVAELTGKQTIYQMIRLAERIKERGGTPADPLIYKHEYHDLLMKRIDHRREALRTGQKKPDDFLVAGARPFLEMLCARGLRLCLASGTDEPFVKEEADLLNVTRYFGNRVYGAQDDYKTFSKKMVIERILRENEIKGQELVAFGDGYVEIENAAQVGGYAVGLATDEAGGGLDQWKRQRLLRAGASVIVQDFVEKERLAGLLFGEATR
jgi:phosphoglycolate phosphatase